MMQQGVGLAPAPDRHHQRVGDELRRHRCTHRPAHDTAREQVDHGSHVQPALGGPDVGKVGDPLLVRRLGGGADERRGGDRQAAFQDRAVGRGTGFFSQSVSSMSVDRRHGMIEAVHADLSISRSSFYYAPQPESDETLALMRAIDAAFSDMPWYGSRQMARHLPAPGREHQSPASAAVDDQDGAVADLPAAAHQRSAPAAPDLSVSAATSGDRAAEPGMVRRNHLHPDAAWLPVPDGDHGLGNSESAGLAAVEHDGPDFA